MLNDIRLAFFAGVGVVQYICSDTSDQGDQIPKQGATMSSNKRVQLAYRRVTSQIGID